MSEEQARLPLLSFEALVRAAAPHTIKVDAPTLGGSLVIRELNVGELRGFKNLNNIEEMTAYVVSAALIEPKMTLEQARELRDGSRAEAFDRWQELVNLAMEHSGMNATLLRAVEAVQAGEEGETEAPSEDFRAQPGEAVQVLAGPGTAPARPRRLNRQHDARLAG